MRLKILLFILANCGILQFIDAQLAEGLTVFDTRNVNEPPSSFNRQVRFDFKYRYTVQSPGTSYFGTTMTIAQWVPDGSGDKNHQLHFNDGGIFYRTGVNNSPSWESWRSLVLTDANGKVGIGASNSLNDALQIGDFNNTQNLKINIPGVYNFEQVRLGQYGNGSNGLELINHVSLNNSYGVRLYTNVDEGVSGLQIQTAAPTDSYSKLAYTTRMVIDWAGRVGIGTKSPGNYLLNVAGPIRASEIVVNTDGADFVFEPTYKLRSLSELETFIRTNKHLPDIAPAKEMQQNGVSAGEMQTKLLQKVEELTLYVIELKKENEQKDKLMADQQQLVLEMKKEIEQIKKVK